MNRTKRNLKLFTLLAALLAGNAAFAPDGMIENNPDWTEPIYKDPVETRVELERKAQEQEQRRLQQEEYLKNEPFLSKARRSINRILGIKPKETNVSTSSTRSLFSGSRPVRRTTGETEESGTPLLTSKEAATPERNFDVLTRADVPTAAIDLTSEEIQKLTPQEIDKFSQSEIRDLGIQIADLSPETLESLSKAQTVALTFDQITMLFLKPDLASKLKIENLNPKELSKVFNSINTRKEALPNEIVDRFTQDQISAIFKDNPKKLDEYFTPDQLKAMTLKIPLKDKATRQLQSAKDWLNSSKVGKWLNKMGDRRRDAREAARIARSKANGTFDDQKQNAFESHLSNLSTKEKEEVANAWADTRISKVRDIEQKIEALKKSNLPKDKEIEALKTKLAAEIEAMDNEMFAFTDELQSMVSPNEVVIPLRGELKKGIFGSTKSDDKVFEIIDMTNIDPTKSISGQYSDLKSTGFFGFRDPAVSYLKPKDLLNRYGSWVAKGISIDPTKPVAEQLETQTQKMTGKKWSEFDPSIKVAIMVRLDQKIQDRFTQDAENKNTAGAARAKKELQSIILAMNPDEIETLKSDEFKNIEPETIANFSKEQVLALNLDQIEALSPEQYNALDFTKLRPRTIAVMLPSMPAEKIATLTQKQLQALPKGRLSSALAKLSVADLQIIESAFKSAGNSFEATAAREIARKTPQEPEDSYNGSFNVQRVAVNNAEILNTPAKNISKLSLDAVRDLDPETAKKMTEIQINSFTQEQLNALRKDTIKAIAKQLTTEQLNSLNENTIKAIANNLNEEQLNTIDTNAINTVLDILNVRGISSLKEEQLKALPKGRLSAVLDKLSVADLQKIELAFESKYNPFEATVTRAIARKTAQEPEVGTSMPETKTDDLSYSNINGSLEENVDKYSRIPQRASELSKNVGPSQAQGTIIANPRNYQSLSKAEEESL